MATARKTTARKTTTKTSRAKTTTASRQTQIQSIKTENGMISLGDKIEYRNPRTKKVIKGASVIGFDAKNRVYFKTTRGEVKKGYMPTFITVTKRAKA